jgi:hypothetical protein
LFAALVDRPRAIIDEAKYKLTIATNWIQTASIRANSTKTSLRENVPHTKDKIEALFPYLDTLFLIFGGYISL